MVKQRQGRRSQQSRQNPINDLISEINNADSLKKVFVLKTMHCLMVGSHKTAESLSKDAMNSNQLRRYLLN